MIFLLTRTYGLTGAACAWLIGNALYYIIVPPIMFRRVLKGHYQAWIIRDTLPFLAVGVGSFGAARWLVGEGSLAMKVTAATAGLLAYTVLTIGMNANLREAVLRSLPIRLTGLKAQQ